MGRLSRNLEASTSSSTNGLPRPVQEIALIAQVEPPKHSERPPFSDYFLVPLNFKIPAASHVGALLISSTIINACIPSSVAYVLIFHRIPIKSSHFHSKTNLFTLNYFINPNSGMQRYSKDLGAMSKF
jgi:hypothetical protein